MERHTLHDAATNAATQPTSSNSYSAWRTSQQTQPRILQYNPPQQSVQQSQSQAQQAQQPHQSPVFANQTVPATVATTPIPADLKSNIIFQNAQQFMQNPAAQPHFNTLQADSASAPTTTDSGLSQTAGDSADKPDGSPTGTGGRVLATSKRAAQNRAAQRAFRQRKERYIKSLEQKATEYDLSAGIIQDLRKENIYLRDYVVRLQNEVDSLNTELGRQPMFGARNTQTAQTQSPSLNVPLPQSYPIQIDHQTAAAAVAGNIHAQADNQPTLSRLAPAEPPHSSMNLPVGNEQTMTENKTDDAAAPQKKTTGRSRKRKNDAQTEPQ